MMHICFWKSFWLSRKAVTPAMTFLAMLSWQATPAGHAAEVDWGVSQSGLPGTYSWQHLYNWNADGLHQTSAAIPNAIGDIATLNLLNLLGNQTINLNGAVTLGTLNLGDATGQQSYTIAPGAGGSLILNNGGTAAINKSGIGSDVISSNVTLTSPVIIDVADGRLTLSGLLSGAGGITKNGTGTLILAGGASNTYTGVTTLNNGITLALMQGNGLNALGTTAAGQHTIINSGATFATANDLDNPGVGVQTMGGYANNEIFVINGDGYLGQGAIRKMMGREQDTLGGAITMGSAARIQGDFSTLSLSGTFNVSHVLTASGASGFVSLGGVVSGSADIIHYGISGFRMQNNGNTYSGTLTSNLGEIRADTGDTTTGVNPYSNLSALNLRNSALRLVFAQAAGTAPNVANNRFSTTAPISMRSSLINLENSGFTAGGSLITYDAAQAFGVTTLESGGNKIYFRSAALASGSVTMTFADLIKPNPGTTLEFQIDSLTAGELGTSTKHRIINSALEAGPTTVPFLGGWAYYDREFLKYVPVASGGNGYRKLENADQAIDTAEGTWASGQNIRVTSANRVLALNTSINSLNIRSTTARTLSGSPGTTLVIESGGIITSDATHTISVPFLTAGAAGGYQLYDIAWNSNNIRSSIINNAGNAVSFIKAGANTTSFFSNNTYTGTTYLVEGMFRDIIGARNISALGSGNLNMSGDADSQAAYETDRDFTRALGTGSGQVQLTGGGGFGGGSVGFSAFGAPVDVNFGGAGATVIWGSATFNPGIFTLNGGNATHVVTMVNRIDLGGEQRYIRLDGSASGGSRAVLGTISGDLINGGVVKRGGGVLYFDTAKTYTGSTILSEGELWLRGTGTAGANVTGNDIFINAGARLIINGPDNIGSRQMISLQNNNDDTPAAIAFGAGYGTGSDIRFRSYINANNSSVPQTGPYDIVIANQQTGTDIRRSNRVAIQLSGIHDFQNDVIGQIKTVAPDVQAWFGADTRNGTYTGSTLTATGRTKTGTVSSIQAFRLGSGGGTLIIANENVLSGAFPLIVGAEDQNGRTNIGGVVYLPKAQDYTGTRTETIGTSVTYGTMVGAGGILVSGQNGALNAANNTILLRAGELRLGIDPTKTFLGGVDRQYDARNIDVRSATGTLRTATLSGGSNGVLKLNNFLMRMDDGDRTFQMLSIGTHRTATHFDGTAVLENEGTARTANFNVGNDNDFQSGLGLLVFNTAISQTGAGAVTLQKNNGGVLVLNADNTYAGNTIITQGRLVAANTGAAGNAGSTISLTASNDRRAEVDFRLDGTGPFAFDNALATAGGNDGSSRYITVGSLTGASSNQEIRINSLTSNAGGAVTTGNNASGIWFDGFNGYRLTVTGTTTLTRTLTDFRTRGSLVTLSGVVGGAGALNKYEQGTLVLGNNNTYAGATATYGGYLVLGHDNALGTAVSAVTFNGGSFSQILASGTRTISRSFTNSASGSTQTLGGLDAGAKVFSGAITATRALNLTAITGGDTSFTGTISGAGGINKVGNGTVILNPTVGTGNTYTGPTLVSQGTLIGEAKAAGSPFGVNSVFTVSNGTLRLNNNTGASNTTVSTAALNINTGNASLIVDGTGAGGNATTFRFGSLVRTNNATLTVKGISTDIGSAGNEKLSFTAAPTLLNGTIGTWAAVLDSASNAAHYAGFSGGNVVTATYGGTGDLDTVAGDTQLFDAGVTGGILTANRSVFAFRSNANVALGGFTLNLGSANASTLGQAGMILNGGADVSGGTIHFGTNALSIYTDDSAVSTISAVLSNFRENSNNTFSSGDPGVPSAAVLIKYGAGTLELSGANTFQGNIQVNQGTLSLMAANVIPTFANLSAINGSIVTIRPGATVKLNGFNQEFGNLSSTFVISPVQNGGGTLDLGTATLTVGRQSSNQSFSGQIIGGAGSKIVKIGTGRLTLDNWNATIPNSFETADILQGVFTSFANDQSWATPTGFASSIPGTTSVFLRGGEWEIRTPGDSTTNFQIINLGNHVIHQGGDSTLDTDRAAGSTASNKIITLGNLTLDVQRFLVTGGNANYPRFDGSVTLTNHARIQTDAPLLLGGTIAGNYTLTKTGGNNLEINGDNSAWNGGTVATDGTILFGTRIPEAAELYQGGSNVFSYSASANLGTGDIVINRSTAIRINTPGNILAAQGQRVQTFGSAAQGLARVDIGIDAPLTDYQIRSTTNGAVSLGLNEGFYTSQIDQSKLGNGKWGVSAWVGTYYTADSMGAGVDNVYRFTGTNGGVLGITQSGALSGTAGLQVGADMVPNGIVIGNGNASVRLYGDQTYTGNTIVFRNRETGSTQNFLEITGDSASPIYDVYGRLMARGAGRFTDDAGNQVNTVNLHVGSTLRLDYNMDVNDTMLISRLENSNLGLEATENKWGDNTAMLLNGATLNMISSSGRVNRERVGAITVRNGAAVYLERNGGSGQIILETSGITRDGQATFAVRENANELGTVELQGMKFFIDNGATMLDARGLLPVWMTNPSRNTFLTYNNDLGVQNAAFTNIFTTGDATAAATFLNGLTSASVASFAGGQGDPTLAGTVNVHALQVAATADNETTFTGGTINIHSGGLIAANNNTVGRVNFNTTNLFFGDGTLAREAVIYNGANNITTRIGGVVTAANLTMHGIGNLQLTNTANAITGNIQINSGKLFLDGAGTASSATITLAGDWLQNNDGQQMAELWFRTNNNANTSWNNSVIIAGNTPYARIIGGRYTGTSTAVGTNTIQNLTIQGTNTLQGTSLIIGSTSGTDSANTHNLTVNGTTTIGGNGNVGIRVDQSGRIFTLVGAITGAAPIFKSGDGVLRLEGNNDATLSSAITLNRGELIVVGPNAAGGNSQAEGTGAIRLNFGTLRLAAQNTTTTNSTTTFFNSPNQHITVAGRTSIVYDRNGGTPATNSAGATIGAAGLEFRTENSPTILFDPVSFGDHLRIASEVVIRDNPFFRVPDATLVINNIIRGNGTLTKGDSYLINFNNNVANTGWTGGFTALQGYSRVTQSATNFTFGAGPVINGPTSVLSLNSLTNIAGGAVSNFSSGYSTPTVLAVSQNSLFTTANLATLFPAANNTSRSGLGGIIALDGVSTSTAFNLSTFQDGYWSLGAIIGGSTYSGNTGALTAGAGNVYRIGGVATLTFSPGTAGSIIFTGPTAHVLYGRPDAWHSAGYGATIATLNSGVDADYGGGTTIARGRDIGGGWYQGTLLVNGGSTTATTFRTPLGTGQVDVYGHLRFASANGGLLNAAGANYTSIVMHTGGRITFDNRTASVDPGGEGRYDDQGALTLNGSSLQIRGTNIINTATTNREDIGALTVMRGSHLRLNVEGTGYAGLGVDSLTRGTHGTLTIYSTSSPANNTLTNLNLGANTAAGGVNNSANFLITNPANVPVMTNNMVAPWIVSRTEDQFLKYDNTNGFQIITQGGAPANYRSTTATTLDTSVLTLNDGTEILSAEAGGTITLGANLDIYAMRIQRNLNVSANGLFDTVTIRSGGLIFLANTPIINANLNFGLGGASEALIYTAQSTGEINGRIRASQVTKFGRGFLNIRTDQPLFSGNWVINEGGIQFLTPGAVGASTSEIILNGTTMSDDADRRDGGASYINTELRYTFNSGSPDLFTWDHGKITTWDNNVIRAAMATDRNQAIPDIDLKTTATVAGGIHPGLIRFQVDGFRSTLFTGTVTLYDHYHVNVDAASLGTGGTSGVQFGALDNQGLYNVIKTGDGVLTLGNNTSTFDGNRFFYLDEGAVRVRHNGAFGAAGNTVVVSQGGALEIAVANFVPAATLDQRAGSMERWFVDGARSGPLVGLSAGVNLQVAHNQTGTKTINLNGGSIMGYLPVDYEQVGVIHSLASTITINLLENSFLGQTFPASETVIYDMGKQNSIMGGNPNDLALRGSYLQIDGAITGDFGLTKVGQDVILLNGANTYSGPTTVKNGILQIGRNNSLNIASDLVMNGSSGQFDLNGYDQEVASLSGSSGSINNGGFDYNTLSVNQATDTNYSGTIDGNVRVRKTGSGTLTFTPVTAGGSTTEGSGYRGGTVIEGGKIAIAIDTALGFVPLNADADNLTLAGGTLRALASFTLAQNRGVVLGTGGGTVEVDPTFTAGIGGSITGADDLSKTGTGTLQLNNTANTYTGDTHIIEGVLLGGGADTLAALSRHIVHGNIASSGTLDLNGANQTIGSLATAGATPITATVALGASTLTVGNDRTQTAAYAGIITGSGIFRVNGNGALQTLAVTNNSAQGWNTEIANGILNVALGGKLGSGTLTLGVTGISGADDFTGLNLSGATSLANNITITNVNTVGSVSLTGSGGAASSLTGTIALGRDTFVGATGGSELGLTGNISGAGRLVKVDAGTVRLAGTNSFVPGTPGESSGSSFAGSTLVRAGTVLLESNTAAGSTQIALGDVTSTIGAAVDRATFVSILGSGTWNPNGDGLTDTSGGQIPGATTGNGAFIGVSTIIDGFDYASSAPGTRILIAGEEANPERNGIYVISAINGAVMNLVRADDFENSNQMKYGGQVAVTNGTYAGDTFFMFEEDIVVKNETTLEPIRFREDVVNPNLAVLQNTAGLTVANDIEINATNGTGTVTLGGSASLTTGTGTFSGTVQLQDRVADSAETKTVQVTSAITSGNGIIFSGAISEADPTAGTGDVLSLNKIDAGTVSLTAANTYSGTTTVTGGKLQLGDGGGTGSLNTASAISVSSGATFAVNQSDTVTQGTDLSGAAISGDGSFEQNGTGTTILTANNTYQGTTTVNAGILLINGNQSGAIGDVTVKTGATLGGTGTVGNLVDTDTLIENGGTLTAGTVAVGVPVAGNLGTLTFNGDLTLQSTSSIWLVDLVQGTGADRINVGGNLNLNGATLDINFGDAFTPFEVYTIAQYGIGLAGAGPFLSGEFDGWVDGQTIGNYTISYGDGSAGSFITLTAVPEPGTFGLLGLALAGFFFCRIRKRRAEAVASVGAGE